VMSAHDLNTAKNKQDFKIGMLTALWGLVVSIVFFSMVKYQNSASVVFEHPQELPQQFAMSEGRDVLIMALHPHCPCSRASLGEMQKLQTKLDEKVRVVVLVYIPDGQDKEWSEGFSIAQMNQMNLEVHYDTDGRICRELGLNTSGETLLYDANGTLRFSGGITASRGHAGSNYGIEFIQDAIRGEEPERAETPVFGCAIRGSEIEDPCSNGESRSCNVE